jgi:hypothetical protein
MLLHVAISRASSYASSRTRRRLPSRLTMPRGIKGASLLGVWG